MVSDLGQALPQGFTISFSVDNGELALNNPPVLERGSLTFAARRTFKRMAKAPKALKIKAMPSGKQERLSRSQVTSLTGELKKRQARDQALRRDPARFHREGREGQMTDYVWLKETVRKYGWIDVERFGMTGTFAAFLIAQHSCDMRLRLTALEGIEKDYKAKKPVDRMYAWLHDRNALYLQGTQRYGTHFRRGADGAFSILPLENPKRVEHYRRAVRMQSLAAYKKQLEGQAAGTR